MEDADRIIVMDGGRIDAVGTHQQLLETNEIYREYISVAEQNGGSACSTVKPTKPTKKRTPVKNKGKTIARLIKLLFRYYPFMLPVVLFCIVFNAVISSVPSVFMQNVIAVVESSWESGDWSAVAGDVSKYVTILAVFYILSLAASFAYSRMMAVITQGSLMKLRVQMFGGMQTLPVKYFDTHNHGDIMSHYTNDIDTLRQLISQSLPQLLVSAIVISTVLFIMLYYCVWLTLVVIAGVCVDAGRHQKDRRPVGAPLRAPAAGARRGRRAISRRS